MADSFYGLNRGKQLVEQVTEGAASAPSTDVEVRINRDAGLSRLEALFLIDTIKYNILRRNFFAPRAIRRKTTCTSLTT